MIASTSALRIVVGVVLTWVLVVLAGIAIIETPLHSLDEWLFRRINGLGPAPDLLWTALDPHTRNYVVIWLVTVIAAVVTDRAATVRIAVTSLASAVVGWGLLEATYAVIQRDRPEEALGRAAVVLDGHDWSAIPSYPSGHMAISTALCAVLAINFRWLAWPAVAYIAALGGTRVLFGAHFPGDVIAGVVLGVASAVAITRLAGLPLVTRQPDVIRQ